MKRRPENDDLCGGGSSTDGAGCSNSEADDEIRGDVLDLLDVEGGGPSDDGGNGSDPVLKPKHNIFLSHSGIQKDFTELVCRELERWGYNPFFDIREDSLPKGKKFPDLIFRAAGQCRVAVLILSEAFFSNTKWPMLELAAFLDAQKRNSEKKSLEPYILPVYLELTRGDCKKDDNIQRWQKKWEEMEKLEVAERMKAMSESGKMELEAENVVRRKKGLSRAEKWKDALKVLGGSNGIEYERSSGQAGLIDRIVRAVRGLVPPPNMASDASIRGKERICKAIIQKIGQTTWREDGVRVVGIYGVGGIGKTTFCKELCYQLYKKFEGRVCHVELGSRSEKELRQEVVRKLTDVNPECLSVVEDSKICEHLMKRMGGEKVFLAVDNVWQESKPEAMFYVHEARYGRGSIVVVTGRTIDILEALGIDENECFEMPELEEEDARELFLQYAGGSCEFQGQTNEDEKNIRYCIKLCQFSKGGEKGVQFHPLALRVLGLQLQGTECNPRKWVESLSEGNKFNHDRRKEHPIFHILGRGYDLLEEDDKLLFMDAVLFNPGFYDGLDRWGNLYEWSSMVHWTDESSIRKRLQCLKSRGLLEDILEGTGAVIVHDLYREFARFEANRGKLSDRWWVWHNGEGNATDLVEMPPGSRWSNVKRVVVRSGPSAEPGWWKGIEWQHFANVVVLEVVVDFRGRDAVFVLRSLRRLRSLRLFAPGWTVIGLGELRSLGWLDLMLLKCSRALQEIGRLKELQSLRLQTDYHIWGKRVCVTEESKARELLNLEKCVKLKELVVRWRCLKAMPDLGGLTSLRKACFECPEATEGPGLSSHMSALQELKLLQCKSLGGLPGLSKVVSLRKLSIEWCESIVELQELGDLVALEEVTICGGRLRGLPDMHRLTKLRHLILDSVFPQLVLEVGMLPSQLRYLNPEPAFGFNLFRYLSMTRVEISSGIPEALSAQVLDFIDLSEQELSTVVGDVVERYWQNKGLL